MKAHALDQKIEAFARQTSRALQLDGICHAGGLEEHQHFLGFVRIHARRDSTQIWFKSSMFGLLAIDSKHIIQLLIDLTLIFMWVYLFVCVLTQQFL